MNDGGSGSSPVQLHQSSASPHEAAAAASRRPLERLYAATAALSAVLDDEQRLLQRIADELARLVDARYAALGILGADGTLIAFETIGLTPEEEEVLRPYPPHGRGILGALLREGKPLRLEDLTQDPRSAGFPEGHPVMRTFLGVPLIVGEQVIGRLYTTEHRGGPFTAEDEMLAQGFAAAAAVAMQSARQTGHLLAVERLRVAGELAMGVAHDFNNLLATILGRTEVLLGQVRDAEQRSSLEAIQRAARDGAATVSRMREYGRPVDVATFEAVDLGAVVREAVQLTRPRWHDEAQREGRTIEVKTELKPAPPVHGDPVALREVLVNLLFNASDALPRGGTITISVEPAATEASPGPEAGENRPDTPAHASPETARDAVQATGAAQPVAGQPARAERHEQEELRVHDTGVGIPEDVRPHIFDPFFTTKGVLGTGLGLAMVRKVMDAHQGTVEVESTTGAGTTFCLRLPISHAATVVEAGGATAGASGEDIPPAKIVLVDDQQDVLDTMGMLLRRDGHDVRAFHDPRTAVEASLIERPDVILTDLGMPGLSGWDVARLVHERWPDLPVILLTGWGRDITAAQLREHGVLSALAKPVELPVLRQALARALPPAETAAPAPLHILLVDDATAFAAVLSILLGQGGHTVHRVERAAQAIEVLAGDEPVDLVILDLNLPDLPSREVLTAAHRRERSPAVCVVSGSAPQAMRAEVPGADAYAEKAYVPEQLERLFAVAQRKRHT